MGRIGVVMVVAVVLTDNCSSSSINVFKSSNVGNSSCIIVVLIVWW